MTALRAIRIETARPRYPDIAAAVLDDVSAVIAEHRPPTDAKTLHVLLLAAEVVAKRMTGGAPAQSVVLGRALINGKAALADAVTALRTVQELEAEFYNMNDDEAERPYAIDEAAGDLSAAADDISKAWGL